MGQADDAVAYARSKIGDKYVFGAAGPNTFDCSGLIVAAYKSAGIALPHYTGLLIAHGSSVSKADLAIGDLVFPEPTHVQLYSGNGMVVEAPHTGAFVREVKMWGFWQARRITAPGTGSATSSPTGTNDVTTVGNPLNPLTWVGEADQFQKVAETLTNPDFWRRAGLLMLGAVLVFISILFILRKQVEGTVSSAAKVGEVAAIA